MKKALIVANLAGFASFLLDDMDILKTLGFEVHFCANGDKLQWEDTRQALEKRKIPFWQVDFDSKTPLSSENIKAYQQISVLLKKNSFEVIHCHTPIVGLIVRLAAMNIRRRGAKVIYTTHGFPFTTRSSAKQRLIYQGMERFASRLCDAIITINTEDYSAAKNMHCQKVYYIHGVGVNLDAFQSVSIDRQAYHNSLGVSDSEIMVLAVGELSERKNHQIIIEALSRLTDRERYTYVICGNGIDGGTGRMLSQMARDKDVRLILLGFRSDIPEITCCSNIGVLPSVREGLGLAGIQSLAAGIPIVGTDVQGIRDYILNGETGYLCEPFDADGFACAIVKLESMSIEQRNEMALKCVSVANQFSMDISHKERLEIYKKVLLRND